MTQPDTQHSEQPTEMTRPTEQLLQKLGEIHDALRGETGGLVLFGLFERGEAPWRWDLVVAADWVDSDGHDATAYVAGRLQQKLTVDELVFLAGVVALPSSHAFVHDLLAAVTSRGGPYEIESCEFNGIPVAYAWIFVDQPNEKSRFRPPPYIVRQPTNGKIGAIKGQKSTVRRR